MALSTIGTAAIADDAVTSAKVDSTTTAFTVADLVVTNGVTAGTDIVGNSLDRILLDASAAGTDVGENFLLNATDGSASNDGSNILFEDGTNDAAAVRLPTGTVLQVLKFQHRTAIARTGTGFQEVMTAPITPRSTHSKIMVFSRLSADIHGGGSSGIISVCVYRGTLAGGVFAGNAQNQYYEGPAAGSSVNNYQSTTSMILDSPKTTSEVTYTLCFARGSGGTVEVNTIGGTHPTEMTLMEIG